MLRLTPFNGDLAVTSTTYDRVADTFCVRFASYEIPVAEMREVAASVLLDLDAEGAVIGGEVLSARALLGSELDVFSINIVLKGGRKRNDDESRKFCAKDVKMAARAGGAKPVECKRD